MYSSENIKLVFMSLNEYADVLYFCNNRISFCKKKWLLTEGVLNAEMFDGGLLFLIDIFVTIDMLRSFIVSTLIKH